jgi:diaminohydroxyphosphoribosylaminopyrimidine deaminase/5-amino-6-(5-phosphoribosylamino)uracil reductase
VEQSRPYVVLKWAQDIAGRLTPLAGQPRIISGPAAHRWVHRLRARVDGILVGIETALRDDPQLTARGVPVRRVATRIVLDSHLRLKPTARLVRTARTVPTLVVTTHSAVRKRRAQTARLRRAGVRIEACRAHNNRVDLVDALNRLGALRMTNLLVEGGAAVINEFLTLGLADEAFVFVAPRLLDGGVGGIQFTHTGAFAPMTTARRVGSDTLYHIRFREPDQSA